MIVPPEALKTRELLTNQGDQYLERVLIIFDYKSVKTELLQQLYFFLTKGVSDRRYYYLNTLSKK